MLSLKNGEIQDLPNRCVIDRDKNKFGGATFVDSTQFAVWDIVSFKALTIITKDQLNL